MYGLNFSKVSKVSQKNEKDWLRIFNDFILKKHLHLFTKIELIRKNKSLTDQFDVLYNTFSGFKMIRILSLPVFNQTLKKILSNISYGENNG